MPITSSAKKALRASKNKAVFNLRHKKEVAEAIKKVKKFVAENKVKEAEGALPMAFKALDKACKTKMIHKNTADRKKSRLAKLINKSKTA